jgi:hypothetical protein
MDRVGPDGAGRTRPEGRRRPQTATNHRDALVLAITVVVEQLSDRGTAN